MSYSIKSKLVVLALSITSSFCFGQQNRSAICRLGELTNDSLLPYVQSLEIDCNKDVKTFVQKSAQLTSIKQLQLKGDATPDDWENLFKIIKIHTSVKTILLKENTFTSLPYGYEGLFNVENITFQKNEELDYSALINQLEDLPNIKELSLEVVTIFEVPNKLDLLKNIETIRIINTDESISDNDSTLLSLEKEPVTYDYSVKKENGNMVVIKYTAMAGEIDSDEYKELAKRFTTTNNFVGAPTSFLPKYKYVDPPIKGIDVERTTYTINPQIENIITYPSGTKILIPANAFLDKTGNPITSSVTLSYREFRDPVDFLVSGIPMKYDTAGEVTNFESAGMFELLASSNSEPLTVAPGKKIDMNFATTSSDSTYNFYTFNDSTGNWEYLNKPKTVTKKTAIELKMPTSAYKLYESYTKHYRRITDKTPFNERFEKNEYVYTNNKENTNNNFPYRANRKDRWKSMYTLVKIINVKKTKEGDVLFKVTYLDDSHPEMREIGNVYFALNEEMSASEFKQKYARRKYYNDIRVVVSGNDVELMLKDTQSVKSISASIVTLNDKGKPQKVKNISARMKRYNKQLASRQKKFDVDVEKERTSTIQITDSKKLSLYAYNEAIKLMTTDEKKMSYKEWEDYCAQTEKNIIAWNKQATEIKLAQLNDSEANASKLVQSLSLSGTGIYNCDQIQRMKEPVEIFARYKTNDNKKLKPQMAYVMDKTTNSVFQYDGYRGYSADKIAFSKSKKAKNTLLAIEEDGSITIYKPEEFQKNEFRNKSHFDFVVTKIDSKLTSVSELKALIGF